MNDLSFNDARGFFDVHVYIDPETREVAGVYAYSFFGISVRDNADWVPAERSETRADEFTRFIDYEINWSIDYEPVGDSPSDEDEEHQIIQAYDNDELTWEMIKKYCVLVHDQNGVGPSDSDTN